MHTGAEWCFKSDAEEVVTELLSAAGDTRLSQTLTECDGSNKRVIASKIQLLIFKIKDFVFSLKIEMYF